MIAVPELGEAALVGLLAVAAWSVVDAYRGPV
jgi:hypothetical protein